MTPMDKEPDVAELGWRLAAAEKRQDSFDAGLLALRGEIGAGFAALRIDIKEQRLVTKEFYDLGQATQDEKIASAIKLAMWSLGLVCTMVITILGAILVRLATA